MNLPAANPSQSRLQRRRAKCVRACDTSDIAPLDEAFLAKAQMRPPLISVVSIVLDADVYSWFEAQGLDYQERINDLLRAYMEAHQAKQ